MRATYIAIIGAVAAGILALQGCDFDSLISTRTPDSVQRSHGLPAKQKLPQARDSYQLWHEEVRITGAQWRNSIEQSEQAAALIRSLALDGLAEVSPILGATGPVGVFGLGLLGLFLRRPGDVSKADFEKTLRKEKQDSYNKGREDASV